MSRIIRVFPRKTKATPTDDLVRFGPPILQDQADEVRVSVTFDWDKPKAERLADLWGYVAKTTIGGPAYGDPGGEFVPGVYLRHGYTITSRGCPNRCGFCLAQKREGKIRELPIRDGYIVQDNNLLACSRPHVEAVFDMLARQPEPPRFAGGIEAARLEDWHVERMAKLKPDTIWMAYDTPNDWEPLVVAADKLRRAGLITSGHRVLCYVLIGWPNDTMDKAEARLSAVARLGIMPFAMLWDKGAYVSDPEAWITFQRSWANKFIVGAKMKAMAPKPSEPLSFRDG